jgi:hypothetical protein
MRFLGARNRNHGETPMSAACWYSFSCQGDLPAVAPSLRPASDVCSKPFLSVPAPYC